MCCCTSGARAQTRVLSPLLSHHIKEVCEGTAARDRRRTAQSSADEAGRASQGTTSFHALVLYWLSSRNSFLVPADRRRNTLAEVNQFAQGHTPRSNKSGSIALPF